MRDSQLHGLDSTDEPNTAVELTKGEVDSDQEGVLRLLEKALQIGVSKLEGSENLRLTVALSLALEEVRGAVADLKGE